MRIFLAAPVLLTMACAAVPPDDSAVEPGGGSYRCNAEPLADLVGRPASQELGAEALRRSGARSLRWIRPGDMVTMDYSESRLNIHLDGQGRVERFNCG